MIGHIGSLLYCIEADAVSFENEVILKVCSFRVGSLVLNTQTMLLFYLDQIKEYLRNLNRTVPRISQNIESSTS